MFDAERGAVVVESICIDTKGFAGQEMLGK